MSELGLTSDETTAALYDISFFQGWIDINLSSSDERIYVSIFIAALSWWEIKDQVNWLTLYYLAIILYDTLLSFNQEIQYIWNRKFGTATIVYLFVKYGIILAIFSEGFDMLDIYTTDAVSNIYF